MSERSFAARVQQTMQSSAANQNMPKGNGNVYLVEANDHTGHRAYYFLQVPALKSPQFSRAFTKDSSCDLEKFGIILASGYGRIPETLRADMQKRYGWNG